MADLELFWLIFLALIVESQKTGIVYSTSSPRVIKELGFFLSDEVQSSAQDSSYTENRFLQMVREGEFVEV